MPFVLSPETAAVVVVLADRLQATRKSNVRALSYSSFQVQLGAHTQADGALHIGRP